MGNLKSVSSNLLFVGKIGELLGNCGDWRLKNSSNELAILLDFCKIFFAVKNE